MAVEGLGLRRQCWLIVEGKSGWVGRREWIRMVVVYGGCRLPGRNLRKCRCLNIDSREGPPESYWGLLNRSTKMQVVVMQAKVKVDKGRKFGVVVVK